MGSTRRWERANDWDLVEWACHSERTCLVVSLIGWGMLGRCVIGYDWPTRSHSPLLPTFATCTRKTNVSKYKLLFVIRHRMKSLMPPHKLLVQISSFFRRGIFFRHFFETLLHTIIHLDIVTLSRPIQMADQSAPFTFYLKGHKMRLSLNESNHLLRSSRWGNHLQEIGRRFTAARGKNDFRLRNRSVKDSNEKV